MFAPLTSSFSSSFRTPPPSLESLPALRLGAAQLTYSVTFGRSAAHLPASRLGADIARITSPLLMQN